MKNTNNIFFNNPPLSLMIICLLCSFIMSTYAQVKTEEVTVIAAYEPSLSDVIKINTTPEIPDTDIDKPHLNYLVTPTLFRVSYQPEPIQAAKITGEPLSKLYQSYIKAGFGNYTSPLAELYYNNLRSRTSNMGIYLKHYSASGEIKDYAPANFSDNILKIYGTRNLTSHIIDGDFQYKRNVVHYFGFQPASYILPLPVPLEDFIYQKYQLLDLNAGIKSSYTDKDKLHHALHINYYNLKDNFEAQENGLYVKGNIHKNVELLSSVENEKIALDVNVAYYNNITKTSNLNTAIVSLKPQFLFNSNQYALNLGINTSIEVNETSYIHFFPSFHASIAIAKDVLSLYGFFDGGLEKHNLKTVYEENPFINTSLPLEFTKNKVIFGGGLKGQIATVLSFNIGGSFTEAENMPFFVTDTSKIIENMFTFSYHDITRMRIFGDFSLSLTDKFSMVLRGDFNHYSLDTEAHAWHKPLIDGSLGARYNLVDKISIKADMFAQTKTYAKTYDAAGDILSVEIPAITDFNLGLEYNYTKKISVFTQFNNLTAARYYKWYNYPSHKFHFLAGLTYAF